MVIVWHGAEFSSAQGAEAKRSGATQEESDAEMKEKTPKMHGFTFSSSSWGSKPQELFLGRRLMNSLCVIQGKNCRPCVVRTTPSTPSCPSSQGSLLTAHGKMTNPTAVPVNVSGSPTPLRLLNGALLRNMVFTEGALQPTIAGTYRITYTLQFGPNDFERMSFRAEGLNAGAASNFPAAMFEAFPEYTADIISAVLLNGVPLSTTMSYMSDVCCESFTMHNSSLVTLPVTSIVSAGIWAGCPYCSANQLVLLSNSELSLERVGNIV